MTRHLDGGMEAGARVRADSERARLNHSSSWAPADDCRKLTVRLRAFCGRSLEIFINDGRGFLRVAIPPTGHALGVVTAICL